MAQAMHLSVAIKADKGSPNCRKSDSSALRGASARYAAVPFGAPKSGGPDSSKASSAAFMPSPVKPPLGPQSKVALAFKAFHDLRRTVGRMHCDLSQGLLVTNMLSFLSHAKRLLDKSLLNLSLSPVCSPHLSCLGRLLRVALVLLPATFSCLVLPVQPR